MSRNADPKRWYTVKIHKNKGYTYASTQRYIIDKETNKKKYHHVYWGTVDENLKFFPGKQFFLEPIEELKKLIFPSGWDLSEFFKYTKETNVDLNEKLDDSKNSNDKKDNFNMEKLECDQNLLYGDIWFLEQISNKIGIVDDLKKTFNNDTKVNIILTLVYYLFSLNGTYAHVQTWQKRVKSPSTYILTPSFITRFTQNITEQDKFNFLSFRNSRIDENELCALDTTSISSFSEKDPDVRFGKNKEHLDYLKQTIEVVVYSITSHMPIFYKTFQGNTPDSRTIDIILNDLQAASFKNAILITDRGFESLKNIEKYISEDRKIIMAAKIGLKFIKDIISEFGDFQYAPKSMVLDRDEKIYFFQKNLEYSFLDDNGNTVHAKNLKLNIYFDPIKRSNEILDLEIALSEQESELKKFILYKKSIDNVSCINDKYCYFDIIYENAIVVKGYKMKNPSDDFCINEDIEYFIKEEIKIEDRNSFEEEFENFVFDFLDTKIIKQVSVNNEKFNKKILTSGFFCNISININLNAIDIYKQYVLRDEQEKYYRMMKNFFNYNRHRCSSLEAKEGRLFILFIALCIGCYINNIRKNSLSGTFCSIQDILEEMRSIRYISHPNMEPKITPFISKQLAICEAFGLEVPTGCAPESLLRKNGQARKRGQITAKDS